MSQSPRIKRYGLNTKGRDLAVGDIHGHFTRLRAALDAIGFNPEVDRLFSVGDLVDRGPESHLALEWLQKPYFHCVQGNHEQMAIMAATTGINTEIYHQNGGSWFMTKTANEQKEFAQAFSDLPIAIEVETPDGLVGLVHADCPFDHWYTLRIELELANTGTLHDRAVLDCCQWSRERIRNDDARGVDGIKAVVCGHTPLRAAALLGNVFFIDTGGWRSEGYFTLLNLHTLVTTPPMAAKLSWEEA